MVFNSSITRQYLVNAINTPPSTTSSIVFIYIVRLLVMLVPKVLSIYSALRRIIMRCTVLLAISSDFSCSDIWDTPCLALHSNFLDFPGAFLKLMMIMTPGCMQFSISVCIIHFCILFYNQKVIWFSLNSIDNIWRVFLHNFLF